MADTYANWAALSAVEVEGTDYRIEVRRTPSRLSHIAIHGGGIEPGSSEVADAVASASRQQYYGMISTKPAGQNATLHITSTHFDEPRCVALQSSVTQTLSYHGLGGTDEVTHLGGLDENLRQRVGHALEAAGFLVEWTPGEEVGGTSPANIANRNRSRAGIQLEMTRGLRESFFPGRTTAQSVRDSGQRTDAFWRYVSAITSVVGPMDAPLPEPGPGLDWGPEAEAVTPSLYRVEVTDLLTDTLIDVLPVAGLTFDDYIGRSGSLSGTVLVPDADYAARARAALIPGRTAIWVRRGSDVWWGGILWTATPAASPRDVFTVDIQAGTFDTYLDHRTIFKTLESTQRDSAAVARSLIAYTRDDANGDIGFRLDGTQKSGTLVDSFVSRFDQRRVKEVLDEMANAENGFEWRVNCFIDGATGERVKAVQFGFPKIYSGATDIMLTSPGNILSYEFPSDATGTANVWQARGGSSNGNPALDSTPTLSAVMASVPEMAGGWPRLDGTSDYPDISREPVLDSRARADLERARTPVVIPSLTVVLDGQITPALLGGTVRLRIRDAWFSSGLDARYRVVGMRVTPLDRSGPEGAEIYLEAL
ncbi:poly-gamma-glutamate hydrolase family protein [Streptomyces sp. NPDC048157]|uniref:poly-gamma-glutamate hydrolase family protein n=1 Tax=Streptomyces sp. NPDC048157 TaxID=3365503 RepID=UPI003715FDB7